MKLQKHLNLLILGISQSQTHDKSFQDRTLLQTAIRRYIWHPSF